MENTTTNSQTIPTLPARIARNGGILLSLGLLLLVVLLLVPLPTALLDLLLVFNFFFGLALLLYGILNEKVDALYFFPAALLVTTLYRLSLNVSSTRLILSDGDQGLDAAGTVIESFGAFVVGGDFLVGAVIFAIIAIVNFVVIARGAARVAEVAARFVLDALPGRQLAIDAELRSGAISQEEAVQQRALLTRESQFFGAMDGAMKFVQGDAIAGFVITLINAIGGIGIGLSRELSFTDAVSTFGILTIGDGLVNIIPSLLISVAAGVVVTRVSKKEEARSESFAFIDDFSKHPEILGICGVVLSGLALTFLIGGSLGSVPFLLVGAGLITASVFMRRGELPIGVSTGRMQLQLKEVERLESRPVLLLAPPETTERAQVHPITLELGTELWSQFSEEGEKRALQTALEERKNFHQRTRGLLIPTVRLRLKETLGPRSFSVLVREGQVRKAEIPPTAIFVSTSPSLVHLFGIKPIAPALQPRLSTSGQWVSADSPGLQSLQRLGHETLSAAEFLAEEVHGACLSVIEELFGLDEAQKILSSLREQHEGLVKEIFDNGILAVGEFAELLRRLVRERVSIRDGKRILEAVSEYHTAHPEDEDRSRRLSSLHSFVRRSISRSIVQPLLSETNSLRAFVIESELESEIASSLGDWDSTQVVPSLELDAEESLRASAKRLFGPVLERGAVPIVVLCTEEIRAAVDEFFMTHLGGREWFRTIAFSEVEPRVKVETVGTLGLA